jgi:hypothetical protein
MVGAADDADIVSAAGKQEVNSSEVVSPLALWTISGRDVVGVGSDHEHRHADAFQHDRLTLNLVASPARSVFARR